MNNISIDTAIGKYLQDFTDALERQGKINKKEDEFTIVIPFKDNQALFMSVNGHNEERKVSYGVSDKLFIRKQLKNVGLNVYGDSDE